MKFKKDLILLGIMVLVAICAAGITIFCNDNNSQQKEKIQIMASFYPMYVIALNLLDGVDGVNIACMTQNQTGCLHDYQITTQDMKTLEHSDLFIINGGGMEGFLENVIQNYPDLVIVNAGESLKDVMKAGHSHFDDGFEKEQEMNYGESEAYQEEELTEHDHTEEEGNAHFWLNPEYYIIQIQTVADGLATFDENHAMQYQKNAEEYIKKVQKISEQMNTELKIPHTGVIVFHDAFVYLAEYLGLDVVHTIEMDNETSLSAGEIAEIMEEIKKEQVSVLFTEMQYSTEIADTIGKETGAVSYVIDSLVTGEGDQDSYLRGMESNLEVLKKAFS